MKVNIEPVIEDCRKIIKKNNLSNFKNKKILIFGSNSFLINYVQFVFHLLNKEHDYGIKIVTLSKSKANDNLKYILKHDKSFKFIRFDLSNCSNLKSVIKSNKFDFVFLAATYGQPYKWMKDELKTFFLNVDFIRYIFNFFKNQRKTKFLYFSSADVYGDTSTSKIKSIVNENYDGSVKVDAARSIYGMSKRIGETLCHYYRRKYNLQIYITRSAHTYGPGLTTKDTRVIIDFFKKAQKKTLKLLDNGSAIKTYGYIADITEMFLNIIQRGKKSTYNTCGNTFISIYELAKKIKKISRNCEEVYLTNKKSSKKHISTDPSKSLLSSKLYCKEFLKKEFIELDKGLLNLQKYLNFK